MRASAFIMGLVIFGAVITGVFTFMADINSDSKYSVTVDESYMNAYENATKLNDNIQDSYEKIQANWSASKTSTLGFITLVPDGFMLVIKLLSTPFEVVTSFLPIIKAHLHLPDWVDSLLSTIFVAAIIFTIIALVLRYRYT